MPAWPHSAGIEFRPEIEVKEIWFILNESDVDWIIANGSVMTADDEITILEEGKAPEHIFIILDGQAFVSAKSGFTTSLNAGCIAGEVSYLSHQGASATISLIPSATAFSIPVSALRDQAGKDAGFGFRWMSVLGAFAADRLRDRDGLYEPYSPSSEVQEKFESFLRRLAGY